MIDTNGDLGSEERSFEVKQLLQELRGAPNPVEILERNFQETYWNDRSNPRLKPRNTTIPLLVYLVATSGKTKTPVNLSIRGKAATGKSLPVEKVPELFPAEEILDFTGITSKTLL